MKPVRLVLTKYGMAVAGATILTIFAGLGVLSLLRPIAPAPSPAGLLLFSFVLCASVTGLLAKIMRCVADEQIARAMERRRVAH